MLCQANTLYITWFLLKKSAIEESITGIRGSLTGHRILFYPKFHCELNHIEYFWCDGKSWIKRNCKYSIEELREYVLRALEQVKSSTILRHYKSCLKKMGRGSGKTDIS